MKYVHIYLALFAAVFLLGACAEPVVNHSLGSSDAKEESSSDAEIQNNESSNHTSSLLEDSESSGESENESSAEVGSSTEILEISSMTSQSSSDEAMSFATESSSSFVLVGTGKFFMHPEPDTITFEIDPGTIDFRAVINEGGYALPEGFDFSDMEIDALNSWAQELAVSAPFAGYPTGALPWIDIQSHNNIAEKTYVFITQEQLAYIYISMLFGTNVRYHGDSFEVGNIATNYIVADGDIISTGLNYTFAYRGAEFDKNYLLLSIMSYLTIIKENDEYKATYIGVAQGGYDAQEGLDKIITRGMTNEALAELNVCYFDEGKKLVSSSVSPLDDSWCQAELKRDDHSMQGLTQTDFGGSFHAVDIPGQTTVNIAGHNFGGGSACPGCHLSGPQDECMPNFYPETIGFNFFMPTNPPGFVPASIFSVKALTFFGVRRYLDGLSGSSTYTGTCGNPIGPAVDMMNDRVGVSLEGEEVSMYHHSMTFVASMGSGYGLDDWWAAERKICIGGGTPNCDASNSPKLVDIGKWYGAFEPQSFHGAIQPLMKTMIRRIGTFNWGAGVWWGDAEQYFFIVWLGTSMLEDVTLDYYIFANSCENAGVQCGLMDGEDCAGCYDNSFRGEVDFSQSCPAEGNGINAVYLRTKNDDVETLYSKLKSASNRVGHVMDGM